MPENTTEKENSGTQPEQQEETVETPTEEPSHNPVKEALEKEKGKDGGKTELEKLLYTEKKLQERKAELLREQGIEEPVVAGAEDDDKPVTLGDLKRMEKERSQKTAISLAGEIADEYERDLTVWHLNNTIRPSGNAKADFDAARAIVNSVKSQQIAEEAVRSSESKPKSAPSGSGAPSKKEKPFDPTPEEQMYMKPPFNLTKEEIIKARQASEAKNS